MGCRRLHGGLSKFQKVFSFRQGFGLQAPPKLHYRCKVSFWVGNDWLSSWQCRHNRRITAEIIGIAALSHPP